MEGAVDEQLGREKENAFTQGVRIEVKYLSAQVPKGTRNSNATFTRYIVIIIMKYINVLWER